MKKRIGITTTVPIEIILAADCIPVDLNNIFITNENAEKVVEAAEEIGYPRTICAWIKGIYATIINNNPVDMLIIVTQGDCSNTISMLETFKHKGIQTLTFDFPYSRDYEKLKSQMEKLASDLGTTLNEAEKVRQNLLPIREKLIELDKLTYEKYLVTGKENHLWLVSSSDFNSNPEEFEKNLDRFLEEAKQRKPKTPKLKLGYLGIPPIISDIYDYIEERDAAIIFNEIQRQFSMPFPAGNLIEQYLKYTYPYDIFHRLDAIYSEIKKRQLHGIIHYVQSFCHRQIEDIILRDRLSKPILTIEGDRPSPLDERLKIRIDSFLDMLSSNF